MSDSVHSPTSRRGAFRRIGTSLLLSFALVASACSGGGGSDGDKVSAGGKISSGGESAPSTAPRPVEDVLPDAGLDLSDDTVIVRSDGGRALKDVPDDPDTIVIDAGAEGADRLAEGKILLLTGVTVVRVAKLQRDGDRLRITGAPVSLPEVIENGELTWDARPIDLSQARLSVWGNPPESSGGGGAPDDGTPDGPSPGGGTPAGDGDKPVEGVPSEEDINDLWGDLNKIMGGEESGLGAGETDLRGRTQLIADSETTDETIPSDVDETVTDKKITKDEFAGKVKIGSVEYSFSYTRQDAPAVEGQDTPKAGAKEEVFKLGLEIGGPGREVEDAGEAKVKGGIEAEVKLKEMQHSGRLKVVDGKVADYGMTIPDLTGEINLSAKLQALSNVASVVTDPLFDLPLSLEIPVPIGGIPFTLDFKIGIQVNLSMALINNTLSGLTRITFGGDAGMMYDGTQFSVFGTRVENAEDLLKAVQGVASGPVGIVFTNELPKISFGLGYKKVKLGVFVSNGFVSSFHILPMPVPCHATNVAYVPAAGLAGKFFGAEVEIVRKAITDKRWNWQVPTDTRCNVE